MRKRRPEQRIFFPWERRGGLLRRLRIHRMRPVLLVSVVIGVLVLVGMRERRQAGIRQTRATLLAVRRAMDRYLADHEGECPDRLGALSDYGSFRGVPRDAWGRPFHLRCPAPGEGVRYEVFSDGPDGERGGLDRID